MCVKNKYFKILLKKYLRLNIEFYCTSTNVLLLCVLLQVFNAAPSFCLLQFQWEAH